jgi:hypothetical protein
MAGCAMIAAARRAAGCEIMAQTMPYDGKKDKLRNLVIDIAGGLAKHAIPHRLAKIGSGE